MNNMKRGMISAVLVMLILVSGLVVAQTSSSSIRRTFVLSKSAVSDEAVFLSPEQVAAMGGANIWDVIIFVAGVIAIGIVLYLIIKKWLGKKPKARKIRRKKKSKK